jgi:hypothetical protein
MKKYVLQIMSIVLLLSLSLPTASVSAKQVGDSCPRAGAIAGTKKNPFVCKKIGKKLVWQKDVKTKSPVRTTTPVKETVSQSNAKQSARLYLSSMAFSRSGLIEQLEFEGYSLSDATYGTDAQKADWNLQASKSAKLYLKTMPFSRSGLIEQLIFEGFSQSQAEYGVKSVGL